MRGNHALPGRARSSLRHNPGAWVAGLCAVAALAVTATFVTGQAGPPDPSRPGGPAPVSASPAPEQPPGSFATTVNPRRAPTPPARGAYFGAWVGPAVFTQANSIAAVNGFQRRLGRRLDIVHTYLRWDAPFPTASDLAFIRQRSLLLVSWAGTDTRAIASGAADGLIRQRAREIKALRAPVFLEWRWEMNRPNLQAEVHSAAAYVAAWKRIRAIFERQHVQNVAWVWCPTASGFADGTAPAYFPGNAEVDWVCADVYPGVGPQRPFAEIAGPFLAWAKHHQKPVMIGEFGVPRSYGPAKRAAWLSGVQRVSRNDPQIKALVYFDADPAGHGPQLSYSLPGGSAALAAMRSIAGSSYFNPVIRPARSSRQ